MTDEPYRRNHYDVTDRVLVSDPRVVSAECRRLLADLCSSADLDKLDHAFDVFSALFSGRLAGYHGCDTWYHDTQHSLDCTLVMTRLMLGHEASVDPAERLGPRRLVLGAIAALFHDAGYVRHEHDPERHGAEFTLYHVRRSGRFLAEFLPTVGFGDEAPMTEQLVHFTGYEIALDRIDVQGPLDRRLGFLLGSADIIAQMSDRCYLEKCRDCLYPEFEICGLAGEPLPGGPNPVYASQADLVRGTPSFMDQMWSERIEGYFEGVYRHLDAFFDGRNPYLEAIRGHRARLDRALADDAIFSGLRRRAECINAGPLRVILGLQADDAATRAQARPPVPGDLRRGLAAEAAGPPAG